MIYGTDYKTIFSEDRRQTRKKEKLEKSSAAIRGKIEKKESGMALQEDKVRESKEKGHGKRLSQRENKLSELRGELDGLNKKEIGGGEGRGARSSENRGPTGTFANRRS